MLLPLHVAKQNGSSNNKYNALLRIYLVAVLSEL